MVVVCRGAAGSHVGVHPLESLVMENLVLASTGATVVSTRNQHRVSAVLVSGCGTGVAAGEPGDPHRYLHDQPFSTRRS